MTRNLKALSKALLIGIPGAVALYILWVLSAFVNSL